MVARIGRIEQQKAGTTSPGQQDNDAACLILIGYRMSFAQWPCTGISTKLWTVPSVNNPLPIISPRLLTVTANMESKSQLEPAGKNVVRSIPWLLALGQRKGRLFEKSSLYPLPTIWPLSLMPAATALLNSPTVLRTIAGLDLLAQNTARSAEKSALRAKPTMFPAPL